MSPRPPLTHEKILAWADAFHARVGRWPTRVDGARHILESTWSAVDQCLKRGLRGLSQGSSLAKLLLHCRQRRHKFLLPPLTLKQILAWADAHRRATGQWPTHGIGPVAGAPGETWVAVDASLKLGKRGLPRRGSLAVLLAEERGVYNHLLAPRLTTALILAWADAHRARTGAWPKRDSGLVVGTEDESWHALDASLTKGLRGLRGGSSLARLLHAKRGVRILSALPRLRRRTILTWADAHRARTGKWPTEDSGAIPDAPGETWSAVESALAYGGRGLSGGDSLARLLSRHRGKRNRAALPSLTEAQILAWADAHQAKTGLWPGKASGPIPNAPGETWLGVNQALSRGRRGLQGGSSIPQLLQVKRGVRYKVDLPALAIRQILAWSDSHRVRTGEWPGADSGPVLDAPGETWAAINAALRVGRRGLPGGASLARLLHIERGVRNHLALPRLTERQVLAWAKAHRKRTGEWPRRDSGAVVDAPGETWSAVEAALRAGARGLPGGSSLFQVIHGPR